MTIERVREALSARPFRPFALHTADATYRVAHPEFMAISPSGRTVIVIQPDDRTAWVDLLLVSAIEFEMPKRRKAG